METQEMITVDYVPPICKSYVPPEDKPVFREFKLVPTGNDLVTIRVKKVDQAGILSNTIAPDDVQQDDDELIPKEAAICKFCFKLFGPEEQQKVLKTQCECKWFATLSHYNCAIEWSRKKGDNKCEQCGHDTRFVPVVILSKPPATLDNENSSNGTIRRVTKVKAKSAATKKPAIEDEFKLKGPEPTMTMNKLAAVKQKPDMDMKEDKRHEKGSILRRLFSCCTSSS